MNTKTDNAIGILSKALEPKQMKRTHPGGTTEIVKIRVAWIPSMQRKYLDIVLNALLQQQERIQVQDARITMLESRLEKNDE